MRPVKPFIGGDAVPTLIQILKICLKTLRSRRTMLDSANVHAHVDEPQSWKRPRCTVSITGSLRQLLLCPLIIRSPTLRHLCGSMLTFLLTALEGTSL